MSGKLQSEIKKRNPFSSTEQEVYLNILKTADVLLSQAADLLKPHGLSPTQYNALRILRGAGAGCGEGGHVDPDAQGLSCREIGQRMITRDPDLTRLLDRLEARGLVHRSREQKDRRMVATRITQAGLDLLRQLDQPVLDLHRKQLGHLGEPRLNALSELLEAARARQG
jgi:MarR family transcriptional regulator, organic hydroperoxide resistance regulator